MNTKLYIKQFLPQSMGLIASILVWPFSGKTEVKKYEYEIYEHGIIKLLIRELEGFAGVYVTDMDNNPLDPDNLPNSNAPDGGMDCVINIQEEEYSPRGFKWVCTRVQNKMDELGNRII